MRLTIIPSDNAVYVDGFVKTYLDLSGCGIPSNVHALQWFGDRGWIEFCDDNDPFTPPVPAEPITALPAWALVSVTVWENTPAPVQP